MRALKKFLAIFTLCTLLICITSTAFAANTKKEDEWVVRRAFLEENMIKIGSQGPDKVDEWLAANGVNKVQDMHGVQATSSPGQAYLTNIDGYFDGLAKKYLIKGWWKWNSTPDATAGALDGVSLAMAKADGSWSPVTGYTFASNPAGIAVYSQNGTYYPNAGNASKIDKSGIVYTFKDGWSGTQYIGYQGQVWAWLDSRPKELPIYIKMDYEHTWTDANLSSFGFSWTYPNPPSINMTWNTVPANWIIANQITLYTWRTVN